MGGQVAFLAILAAIAARERSGRGCTIDLSMQDIGVWSTQTLWNLPSTPRRPDSATHGAVRSVAEACDDPQTAARELIVRRTDAEGTEWELFGSPMKLAYSTAEVGTPIGRPLPNGLAPWQTPTAGA